MWRPWRYSSWTLPSESRWLSLPAARRYFDRPAGSARPKSLPRGPRPHPASANTLRILAPLIVDTLRATTYPHVPTRQALNRPLVPTQSRGRTRAGCEICLAPNIEVHDLGRGGSLGASRSSLQIPARCDGRASSDTGALWADRSPFLTPSFLRRLHPGLCCRPAAFGGYRVRHK